MEITTKMKAAFVVVLVGCFIALAVLDHLKEPPGPPHPAQQCINLEPDIMKELQANVLDKSGDRIQFSAFTKHRKIDAIANPPPPAAVIPGTLTLACEAETQLSIGETQRILYWQSHEKMMNEGVPSPFGESYYSYILEIKLSSCEELVPQIIALSEDLRITNGDSLVKIYDPKTISSTREKVECTGRVLWSTMRETMIDYSSYLDSDGDSFITFSEVR